MLNSIDPSVISNDAFLFSPAATSDHQYTATGRVYAFRNNLDAPFIIKMANGIHFACQLSERQRQSAMATHAIGMHVAFYHAGFKENGQPISPKFKTLIINEASS